MARPSKIDIRDFDPNVEGQGAPEWFVFHGNNPRARLHAYATRGGALQAFRSYAPDVILYRFDFNERRWVEVCRYECKRDGDPPTLCHFCLRDSDEIKAAYEAKHGESMYRWSGVFTREWINKKTDAPQFVPVCGDCEDLV